MRDNQQSRKWQITINNPLEAGLEREMLIAILRLFSLIYWCMVDEVASSGTHHTHIFIFSQSPVRFATLKNRFPTAHLEKAYGSAKENRDYLRKEGKWAETDKAETTVEGTFQEWGTLPPENEEKAPQMFRLMQSVRDGLTTTEIINENPNLAFRARDIDLLRQVMTAEKHLVENRRLDVSYLYGASGSGKTWSIFKRHDAKAICRITNYRHGKGISFDGYNGQEVLVFEEFSSQIPIEDMLNYLDIYPLYLPARYNDRVACYTKVYITSNLPLEEQYKGIQQIKPETWKAFRRRIHHVIEFLPDGTTMEHKEGLPYDVN